MTPLALSLLRRFLGEPQPGEFFANIDQLGPMLQQAHCFDVSDIYGFARSAADDPRFSPEELVCSFLPSPITWLEYTHPEDGKSRIGVMLTGSDGEFKASTYIGLASLPGYSGFGVDLPDLYAPKEADVCKLVLAMLAMINTPKVTGRVQHMPHRGLERRLLKSRKNVGKFPLRAWTEIRLKVGDPRDASGEPSVEAHYTGQKALHFCRAHLRVRSGQLEFVKAHWRGDPSLGVKRSRYKLISGTTRSQEVRHVEA